MKYLSRNLMRIILFCLLFSFLTHCSKDLSNNFNDIELAWLDTASLDRTSRKESRLPMAWSWHSSTTEIHQD